MIIAYKREGSIKGISLGNCVSLSHMLFVDNFNPFGDGTKREAKKLMEILDLYSKTMGIEMNNDKYSILFNGQWSRRRGKAM